MLNIEKHGFKVVARSPSGESANVLDIAESAFKAEFKGTWKDLPKTEKPRAAIFMPLGQFSLSAFAYIDDAMLLNAKIVCNVTLHAHGPHENIIEHDYIDSEGVTAKDIRDFVKHISDKIKAALEEYITQPASTISTIKSVIGL